MHLSSIINICRFLLSILLKGYIKQLLNQFSVDPLTVIYGSFG